MKRGVKIAIAAVAVIGIVAFVIYWNNPESVYRREISQLHSYVVAGDQKHTNQLLARTQAGGDWGKVERAVKDYVQDRADSISVLSQLQNNEDINAALDAESLKKNAPNFEEILKKLEQSKKELEAARARYDRIKTVDDAAKGLEGMDSKYIDEFKNCISGDFTDGVRTNINDAFKMLQGMIDTYIKELNLLAKNPKAWSIASGSLKFSDNAIKKQYDAILDAVGSIK